MPVRARACLLQRNIFTYSSFENCLIQDLSSITEAVAELKNMYLLLPTLKCVYYIFRSIFCPRLLEGDGWKLVVPETAMVCVLNLVMSHLEA